MMERLPTSILCDEHLGEGRTDARHRRTLLIEAAARGRRDWT
jgi:hypothetical protein